MIVSKKIILALTLVSTTTFAAGWVSTDKVDNVAFNTGGFFLYAGDWGNRNNCTRSDAVVLLSSDPNYAKAYALLLAAYVSGKKVRGYSDKCVNFDGQTYNTIRGHKYLHVGE